MQYQALISEAYRLLGILTLFFIVGLLLGEPILLLCLGLMLYVAVQLRNLHLLLHWLKKRQLDDIPDASGLWGRVFDQLSRETRRQIREKHRLKSVISRVETTTSALSDAIILLTRNKEMNWWNQAANRLLDLKTSDTGKKIINFVRHPQFVRYLESEDYTIPLTLSSPRSQDKQLEYQITRFGEGESLLVVRDITRIFKLEQMRKDFVANVSHELRTPLTVIRGYLETLEDSHNPALEANPVWNKALGQMQQQAARMTTLINDLTMLSKLETDANHNNQQTVALKPLLEMICNEVRSISGTKKHKINLHCQEGLHIVGNDRELHSAFSNLITNAVKYSEAGKTITIHAETINNGNLILSVKDEGIGIEQQHISRLTERFYRVDNSRSIASGGTGLGLAIVKHILLRHDARLRIESTPGNGSTFSCVFPAQRVTFVQ